MDNPSLRSWMTINWANQIEAFQAAAGGGTTISITTVPSANPSLSNFGRASMLWSITRDARDPNQAARLVDFLLNNQAAHDVMLGERGIPSNTVIAAAIAPKLSSNVQLQAEFERWMNQPGNSSPFFAMEPTGTAQMNAEIALVTDMLVSGQLTPAQAAQRVFDFGSNVIK
jgi:multiple sugar transport system substrate-binding protein